MKNLFWLLVIGFALYFGYQWWEARLQEGALSAATPYEAEEIRGGPVRDWEQAPGRIIEMQDAMGGGGGGAGRGARNSVQKGLGGQR